MKDNILSQDEVDALLKGVDSGEIETETDPGAAGEAREYDFTAQERIIRGRMPGLEMANDKFSRRFRDSLASAIMKFVDVSVEHLEMVTFSDFKKAMPLPCSINLFKMEPLKGCALLLMEAPMVFALVDYFFGGASPRPYTKSEGRYFTSIEQRIIRRVADIVLEDMKAAWEGIFSIRPVYLSHEMNPQFVSIVTPSEGVIKIEFLVEVEEFKGRVMVCIPYSMVEPIRDRLFSGIKAVEAEADQRWVSTLRGLVAESSVNVRVDLGRAQLSVGDLMNLEKGNIITLGKSVSDEVKVRVEGVPKFRARMGVSRGNKAVKVTKLI